MAVCSSYAIASLAVTALLLAGCAGELENPGRFLDAGDGPGRPATCPEGVDVEADILAEGCSGEVCHSAGESPAGGLDLTSPNVSERLVDVAGSNACGGAVLVVAGDAEASLLFQKLDVAPPCGGSMPLGQPALGAEDLACVRDWIDNLGP